MMYLKVLLYVEVGYFWGLGGRSGYLNLDKFNCVDFLFKFLLRFDFIFELN